MNSGKVLRWYYRNPDLPTTPNDRAVARLTYRSGGMESEVGLVCEHPSGGYWCFTTNPALRSMPLEVIVRRVSSRKKACRKLYDHVLLELARLAKRASAESRSRKQNRTAH